MTELEKIEYAKSFMDKLAVGINPLDGSRIPSGDIASNERLSRCFLYVSDILRQVIESGGIRVKKPSKSRRGHFNLSKEDCSKIEISETPLTVSEISKNLNSLIDLETTRGISAVTINNWLVEAGLLEVKIKSDGRSWKLPTAQGRELGLMTEERTWNNRTYTTVLFSRGAQQFVYDNIEAIIESNTDGEVKASKSDERPWTRARDERLIEMVGRNIPVSDIAVALKRTEEDIRERLRVLGIKWGE